jgi:hypothetical protein
MPRYERAPREAAGEPPKLTLKVQLDPSGKYQPVEEPKETTETIEAAERPPTPDDPRPAAFRQIPPFGGA